MYLQHECKINRNQSQTNWHEFARDEPSAAEPNLDKKYTLEK